MTVPNTLIATPVVLGVCVSPECVDVVNVVVRGRHLASRIAELVDRFAGRTLAALDHEVGERHGGFRSYGPGGPLDAAAA